MCEVNDKFPMITYSVWVAARARGGLPAVGGVAVPTARANSVHPAHSIPSGVTAEDKHLTVEQRQSDASGLAPAATTDTVGKNDGVRKLEIDQDQTSGTHKAATRGGDRMPSDNFDDGGCIATVPQAECLDRPGNTCVICIDILEGNDAVRGLTCGHAFHAACVDPWLTTRCASCPLCKADYYTPVPNSRAAHNSRLDLHNIGQLNLRSRLPAA